MAELASLAGRKYYHQIGLVPLDLGARPTVRSTIIGLQCRHSLGSHRHEAQDNAVEH